MSVEIMINSSKLHILIVHEMTEQHVYRLITMKILKQLLTPWYVQASHVTYQNKSMKKTSKFRRLSSQEIKLINCFFF